MKTLFITLAVVTALAGIAIVIHNSFYNQAEPVVAQESAAHAINAALRAEFCKDMGKGIYVNARLIDASGRDACTK